MPVTLMDRLPLPNLKVYTATSVMLLSVAVYYALSVTSDPNWRVNATLQQQEGMEEAGGGDVQVAPLLVEPATNGTRNITEQFVDVVAFMMQEPLCMWTLINIAYCSLALFGFLIQRLVFGQLRVSEAQRVKDKFWNYVFYKFIFVFGVINVQYMDEVLLWCSWFTLVGFLHLLGQLCKDRFEYLSSSPNSGWWAHARLVCLLGGILSCSAALLAVAALWGLPAGRDTFFFMVAECVLVVVSAVHVCARYSLQLYEADAAGRLAYYTHLFFDSVSLVVELVHVVHMVVYSNMLVSMASLVLLMQLRHLLHELQARVRRHRLYTELADHMSRNYPMASKEEVEKNQDNCAICWEPMKEARKLPCSHLFHNSCLCQWVQQDASCPTCRRALAGAAGAAGAAAGAASGGPARAAGAALGAPATPGAVAAAPGADDGPLPLPIPPRQPNHMFHFDGSRYVSWLPSFSVEVTRVRALPSHSHLQLHPHPPLTPHQIDAMARQVVSMFPQYAGASGGGGGGGGGGLQLVAGDLARTRSVDLTLDNILEGRLPLPAPPPPTPPTPPPTPTTSTHAHSTEELIQLIDASAGSVPNAHESFHDGVSLLGESSRSPSRIQFASQPAEREASLRTRKMALLAAARARYHTRTRTHTHTHNDNIDT